MTSLQTETEMGMPITTLEDSVRFIDGVVRILDRRIFPERIEWVEARTAAAVAGAIRDMVTQSSGPYYAAALGMQLAATQAVGLDLARTREALAEAGIMLATARPTNNHPAEAVAQILADAENATNADDYRTMIVDASRAAVDRYRNRSRALATHAAALVPDGARILTHCWMDTYLVELVRAGRRLNRQWEWVATETRPFLQGARLTAHTLAEMGESVTLISDGMVAAALAPGSTLGPIDAAITAADRVTMDGCVINKVGTLGVALAANAFGVPYHALVQSPDSGAPTAADVVIEERDPEEVLNTLGHRTASPLVTQAWYPAFDVTPSRFVSRIVTDRGAFEPAQLADYFGGTK
ncbi:methylthioribose-1-phosphate isomerase [Rhodoglobus vestalii]|uniref:Methylthioribose-1-phosphate isomerase n=1 Tax=Rhodoglobus vestalii TaxID=193384 RepID=A0A8H2PYU6_9MICO|nr:hypothetical protein [Rhodoglobus vestalii]TQO20679.1 methylthioribose-1-phosphate isomerase [Rhodoglobus vestalii]